MDLGSCPDAKWAKIWNYCSLGEISALQNPEKKKKKNHVWNLKTEQSEGALGQDLWLHSMLWDQEQ